MSTISMFLYIQVSELSITNMMGWRICCLFLDINKPTKQNVYRLCSNMINAWLPFLDDHVLNHEAQLKHFLSLPYFNKLSGILHSQLCTLQLVYYTPRLLLQPLDSKNSLFPCSQLYIENILTEQYSQYVPLLLDFGSLHYFLLNPLEYCHCLLLLLSQFKIDMALKIYQLIPLKCHF